MENIHKFLPIIDENTKDYDFAEGKKIGKKILVNRLNAIHFKNDTLLVKFKHIKFNHTIIRRAVPLPCLGDELECVWADTTGSHQGLTSYKFLNIFVPHGKKLLLIKSDAAGIDEKGIRLILPDLCSEVGFRKVQRHFCKGVQVRLIQNSANFNGVLLEFSPHSIVVECSVSPPQKFQWIDHQLPVTIIFFDSNDTYYTGNSKILKQSEGRNIRNYVLEPLENQTHRFKPKEFRSTRQQLMPQPNVIFKHPLTQKMVNLKVLDLSGSGFAVEELEDMAVLLAGIIVPEIELNFAGSFKLRCKAQVVYRKRVDDAGKNKRCLKCGFALLDMGVEEHRKLLALLHQATDSNSYLSGHVDVDDLWEFFFECGFIYPQKYNFIQANKEKIKETYRKLYTSNPTIARHFTYQENNCIQGHLSMIRFYENTWMLQHHTARTSGSNRAGLVVLEQAGRFSNASHNLYSIHMDFLICYYRPDKKFPNKVFGAVAGHINDPRGCSVDTFAYFHYQGDSNHDLEIPAPWKLSKTEPEDLNELVTYYEYTVNGLMLDALDLKADMLDRYELSTEYQRLGFKREKYVFTLKKAGHIKAIFLVSISDIGLNLSDLTNYIKVFVLGSDGLPRDVFLRVVSRLSDRFGRYATPVLVYPVAYANNQSIPYERLYNLWVLNTQYGDQYFKFMRRLLKASHF